jgi:hypothetical protein
MRSLELYPHLQYTHADIISSSSFVFVPSDACPTDDETAILPGSEEKVDNNNSVTHTAYFLASPFLLAGFS